jgi:phosphatidylglycerophosphatase A
MIASGFYIGFLRGAPGTYASLAASLGFLLAYFYARVIHPPLHLSAVCLIAVAGVFASGEASRRAGSEDPRFVVVDEIAGQLLTYLFVPINAVNLITGFAAFRVFDIWKPFPIRRLERLKGGVGIMADDLMAGVYGNLALQILNLLF